jgi:hypothetical protein
LTETETELDAGHAEAEVVVHWRTLRERLGSTIRTLEDDLRDRRYVRPSIADHGEHAAERRHERLLRLRRLHAKLASREQLATDESALKVGSSRSARSTPSSAVR